MSITYYNNYRRWVLAQNHTAGSLTAFTNSTTATASTHRISWGGILDFAGSGSKTVNSVGFKFGSVTKAGGSTVRAAFFPIDGASGPPVTPNTASELGGVTIANGNASFAANTWIGPLTLDAGFSASKGDALAFVASFASYGGSDLFGLSGISAANTGSGPEHTANLAIYNGTSWSNNSNGIAPNVLIGFSDGTWGNLLGGFVASNLGTFNTNSGGTQYAGLEFIPPYTMAIDAFRVHVNHASAAASYDAILYDSSDNVLVSRSRTGNSIVGTAIVRSAKYSFDPVTLTGGATYRLVVKATAAANVTLLYTDVSASAHWAVHNFDTASKWVQGSPGSWSTTATRRPMLFDIREAGIDVTGGSSLPIGCGFIR